MDSSTNYGTTEMEPKLTVEYDLNKTHKLQSTFLPKHHSRVQLAAVKSNLYNPVQCSLRRYDIENVQGKLGEEHSRNTSPPGLITLSNLKENKVNPPQIICPGYDLLPMPFNALYQEKVSDELSFKKNKDMSDMWKKFMESMPPTKPRLVDIPKNK